MKFFIMIKINDFSFDVYLFFFYSKIQIDFVCNIDDLAIKKPLYLLKMILFQFFIKCF